MRIKDTVDILWTQRELKSEPGAIGYRLYTFYQGIDVEVYNTVFTRDFNAELGPLIARIEEDGFRLGIIKEIK